MTIDRKRLTSNRNVNETFVSTSRYPVAIEKWSSDFCRALRTSRICFDNVRRAGWGEEGSDDDDHDDSRSASLIQTSFSVVATRPPNRTEKVHAKPSYARNRRRRCNRISATPPPKGREICPVFNSR